MYKIYANGSIIFDDTSPLDSYKLIDPRLVLEENAAGSLTFKLPPTNIAYNKLTCMATELIVKQDDVEIWRGRIISEDIDFWKCKSYTAEGELAYLNDTIQPPKKYTVSSTNIRSFLESLMTTHNSQVGASSGKAFNVGGVTVDDGDTLEDSDSINRFTNYESTLQCINEKLVQRLGGHIRIRHQGNARYFDYFKNYSEIGASDQVIRFGKNLLDYASNLESIDWVTAIVPRGARLELDESEQPVPGLEAYTNVVDVATDGTWHTNGSMFVTNKAMVDTYGFISAVVDWDQVTDPVILKNKAKKYLQSIVFDELCLEISAIDLHYLNPQIETLKLQETVRCISEPHGMDTSFPITKIDIDMLNPSNTKYTLGTKVSTSLTSAQNRANAELASYVDDTFIPTESKVLESAKANAKSLIEGTADGGYASFIFGTDKNGNAIIDPSTGKLKNPDRPTGIRVADAIQDSNATSRWLWTWGGLGHQTKDRSTWKSPNVAITMDGKIVADFITAGMISLTGATTQSSSKESPAGKLFLKVSDANGTKIGHWGSDGIWINKGSVQLGTKATSYGTYKKANGTSATAQYPAIINDDGSAFFKYATLTQGCKVGAATINDKGVLGNFGTRDSMSGMQIGDGTFGISVPSHYNPTGSWGGLTFGYESYEKCHWGNTSCILWDAGEENDGWAQGGFFVVRGDPGSGDSGNYTKQTFNAFMIVSGGSTKAIFDEEFYNKVMTLWDER